MPSASATSSMPRATAAAELPAALLRERELGAHGAHHELGLGVLEERAGDRSELRGPVLAGVQAGERDAPGEAPAVEVRDEAAGGAQQRRLAVPGAPGEQAELTGLQLEGDVVEGGALRVGVVVGDALE